MKKQKGELIFHGKNNSRNLAHFKSKKTQITPLKKPHWDTKMSHLNLKSQQ